MKIELNNNDLVIIDMALKEIPYKYSAPLIDKINSQLDSYKEENKEDLK